RGEGQAWILGTGPRMTRWRGPWQRVDGCLCSGCRTPAFVGAAGEDRRYDRAVDGHVVMMWVPRSDLQERKERRLWTQPGGGEEAQHGGEGGAGRANVVSQHDAAAFKQRHRARIAIDALLAARRGDRLQRLGKRLVVPELARG